MQVEEEAAYAMLLLLLLVWRKLRWMRQRAAARPWHQASRADAPLVRLQYEAEPMQLRQWVLAQGWRRLALKGLAVALGALLCGE